jgi:hypothetical protein
VNIDTVIKTEPPEPPTLTGVDRCDGACPAQALVAVGSDNGELHFCAHHWAKFEQALLAQGFEITIDQRELLNA